MDKPKQIKVLTIKPHDKHMVIKIGKPTNYSKMLNYLFNHFRYETYFTSNAHTQEKLCRKTGIPQSLYHELLRQIKQNEIIIEKAKGYYMMNFQLFEFRDADWINH